MTRSAYRILSDQPPAEGPPPPLPAPPDRPQDSPLHRAIKDQLVDVRASLEWIAVLSEAVDASAVHVLAEALVETGKLSAVAGEIAATLEHEAGLDVVP